jgi:hypothetical protein
VKLEFTGLYDAAQRNFDKLAPAVQRLAAGVAALAARVTTLEARHKLDRGTATLTWPGGSPDSSSLVVNHALGEAPAAVVGGAAPGSAFLIVACTNVTATTFTLRARRGDGTSPGAGTTDDVFWTASN